MTSAPHNAHDGSSQPPGSISGSMDDTLRLIANVSVPDGIEERVHAVLNTSRQARILDWPATLGFSHFWDGSSWMRAAAAAAIVLVVGGGGWGVYMHVEHPGARVVVIPAARPAAAGGFSSAGAIRTPQTVKGPEVTAQPTVRTSKAAARKKLAPRHVAPATVQPAAASSPAPADK